MTLLLGGIATASGDNVSSLGTMATGVVRREDVVGVVGLRGMSPYTAWE